MLNLIRTTAEQHAATLGIVCTVQADKNAFGYCVELHRPSTGPDQPHGTALRKVLGADPNERDIKRAVDHIDSAFKHDDSCRAAGLTSGPVTRATADRLGWGFYPGVKHVLVCLPNGTKAFVDYADE